METTDAQRFMERIIAHNCPTEPTAFQLRLLASLKGRGIHRLYRTALRRLIPHSRIAAYMYGRSNRRILIRFTAAEAGEPQLSYSHELGRGQSTLRWVINGCK